MIKHIFFTPIFLLFCLLANQQFVEARGNGGAALVGALGGLAVGTMIGSTAANNSRKSDCAHRKAIKAQKQVEQIKAEREQERIINLERELERRDIEQKMAKEQHKDTTFLLLIVLVGFLMLVVIGLSILILKKR